MRVARISTLEQWETVAGSWNLLTHGVPFRSWEWLSTWWRYYGIGHQLAVLAVFDDRGTLVGAAPWYLEQLGSRGRALRTLGCGEVCSDYPTTLCTTEFESEVAAAVADWLIHAESLDWDLLEFDSLPGGDSASRRLIEQLQRSGCSCLSEPTQSLWRIELPDSWPEYLSLLSRSHRKQINRLLRQFDTTERASLEIVQDGRSAREAMKLLVDLHQRRWRMAGQAGAFASPRFVAFLQDVTEQLMQRDAVQLGVLRVDGRPAAVDFLLVNGTTTYAYQGGMEPDFFDASPGKLLTALLIRAAIEAGRQSFDFLRGDEPYKPHFRARPIGTFQVHVIRPRAASQIRHGLWMTGVVVKNLVKSGLLLTGRDAPATQAARPSQTGTALGKSP